MQFAFTAEEQAFREEIRQFLRRIAAINSASARIAMGAVRPV